MCVHVLCREFGADVLNLKVLMAKVSDLFEHKDKNVEAEVKDGNWCQCRCLC